MEANHGNTNAIKTALSKRETSNLIGSDKVEGTPVYRPNGESIGQIERVMIDNSAARLHLPL